MLKVSRGCWFECCFEVHIFRIIAEWHAVAEYMSICVHAQHPLMYLKKMQRHTSAQPVLLPLPH